MKLGIITDIHEHVEHLRTALKCFESRRVDQVIVIGDIFETGERIEETCHLLAAANAIGVWGNHDFGLCFETDEETRSKYSESVLRFMGSLQPRLDFAGCHFAHIEPWLDPTALEDLWYFGGPPDNQEKLDRIFSAVPNRLMFAGHYHRWLLASPLEIQEWSGQTPIRLNQGRYFMVVNALFAGQYAVLDTDTSEFTPLSEPIGSSRR